MAEEIQLLPPPNAAEPDKKDRPAGIPEHSIYKNRLQEYTQRSSIPHPVYQTINEGWQHAPRFRSTVFVDGTYFTSTKTHSHRKEAEQDAAMVALLGICQKIKDEGCPPIQEERVFLPDVLDTIFCKSILNEYAAKMKLEKPIYNTIKPDGSIPIFVSSLVFNGITHTGETGRNKKEAEQLAARAAILSILESVHGPLVSEIIKSKYKLYTADGPSIVPCKRKEIEASGTASDLPIVAARESSLGQLANDQASYPPLHEFKKPKPETSLVAEPPPMLFVPPALEQSVLCLISGRKKNRKNKKKTKKNLQVDAHSQLSEMSQSEAPCSVAQ